MNYQDFESLPDESLVRDPEKISEFQGFCAFDGMIPVPVQSISSSYDMTNDIEILDENNQRLGYLCGCRDLGDVDTRSITDPQYAAYIYEVDKNYLGLPFRFQNDYLVLLTSEYNNYFQKYLKSSSMWGGFSHSNSVYHSTAYKVIPNKIIALPNIDIPTQYHEDSCFRSVVQPYAFERFLKLYHLLELLFDWFFVEKIKNLGSDLFGVSDLLRRYRDKTELNHLVNLISSKCADMNAVALMLNRITLNNQYISIGEKIFYDYGVDYGNSKSSTGLDDRQKYLALMNAGGFTPANANNQSIKGLTVDGFNDTVIKIAAYWIYRVRCCIAHSRIGEYIMMSDDDEEFIVEVAEPLIREILCQVFKV